MNKLDTGRMKNYDTGYVQCKAISLYTDRIVGNYLVVDDLISPFYNSSWSAFSTRFSLNKIKLILRML